MASFVGRYVKRWLLNKVRGPIGESKTALNMWFSLNQKTYVRFHDVIIPSKSGTTQVDHILISRFGVFIIETKNKGGWIFGSEDQAKWTQTFRRHKYSFQNPLRQTYRQKKILSNFLGIRESNVHTVVYFVGDCKFKTQMPENVLRSGLGRYIKRFSEPVFSDDQKDILVEKLEHHLANSTLTKRDHVKSLRERKDSETTCPRCGSKLKKRTARKGKNAGSQFLGCTSYPKCRYTKAV
jgi:restriction system protein